jgi:hypothetical protein
LIDSYQRTFEDKIKYHRKKEEMENWFSLTWIWNHLFEVLILVFLVIASPSIVSLLIWQGKKIRQTIERPEPV